MAAGTGLDGLLGSIIPNTSTWELILIGALTGAVARAPKVVDNMLEAARELKRRKRSSIAYIAQLPGK